MKTKVIKNTVISSVLALCFACMPIAVFAVEPEPIDTSAYTGAIECPQSGYREIQTRFKGQLKIACQPIVYTQPVPEPVTESTQNGEAPTPTDGGGMAKRHKLMANMLRVCNLHSDKINMIMGRIVERGTRQTELFSTIATRVEKFYAEKGIPLSNYDALVAAVNTAETKALNDISTMKSFDTFKCDGSDPKGQIKTFRTDLKTEIQDLKDFRTAVRNLIVGVKSVTGTTNSGNDSNAQQGGSN